MKLDTLLGTMLGTAYTLFNVGSADIISSVILGAIGALSGFLAIEFLKWIIRLIKGREK
jgi:hypothetical protein